ncbi:MAG TPA: DEAD/DEAH box helicase [Planctomycetes bacterium]|nr:DEAD/DEAH box helicase [Planctomycetota bacterium]
MREEAQRRARERLPRTFGPFFDRFPNLQKIQHLAIEPILEGRDVIVGAPTAAGKTEAVLAPLMQRLLDLEGRKLTGPFVLYIVPTRALVNDVYRRIRLPLERLGVTVGRKTSDHQSLGRVAPQVLVTTPESFDSLLARATRRLLPVHALVLDELHALDGTSRGDQLAALCERLRRVLRVKDRSLQTLLLSATVDRPAELGARYARDPVLVKDSRKRPLRARTAKAGFGEVPSAALQKLVAGPEGKRGGKVLVFANARADVEWLAESMRGKLPFGDQVYAHHGSLSKRVRERVERDFQAARTSLCVATSTLELGIDIGDVDYVALYGVPPDLPSFLQRLGRAGRRVGDVDFLAIARDPGEVLRFKHMLRAAREGKLLVDRAHFDPGTTLQQAVSLLFQNPARSIAPVHVLERLPRVQRDYWSEERLEQAFAHADRLFRRIAPGHYQATEDLEERFRIGNIHSNFGGDSEVEVLEELTGRSLGTVDKKALEQDHILLGGNAHSLRVDASGKVFADPGKSTRASARFKARPAPPIPGALAQDLLSWMGLDPSVIYRIESEDQSLFLHGLGTVHGFLVHRGAGSLAKAKPGRGLAFGLTLERGHQDFPTKLGQAETLRLLTRDSVRPLSRLLGFGPWFSMLPREEQERACLRAADPGALAQRIATADIQELFHEGLRIAARALMAE